MTVEALELFDSLMDMQVSLDVANLFEILMAPWEVTHEHGHALLRFLTDLLCFVELEQP